MTEAKKTAASTKSTTGAANLTTGNVAQELADSHEARVTVPGASNVDARLDNRVGTDRPKLESFPAKPQQIDGPDVMHQAEHTAKVLADRAKGNDGTGEKDVERKGMFSPGPHGLSDESLREGDEPTFGTEGLTAAEAAKGSPKAN